MTRFVWVAAVAAAVAIPPSGNAALRDPLDPPRAGAVTGVSVIPASGRTQVSIAFSGDVEVSDFVLSAPHRIVIDFEQATLKVMPRLYDGIVRGGITSVRVAQTKPNVVRVVLDMDVARKYLVTVGEGNVKLSLESGDVAFAPWTLGTNASVVAAEPAAKPAAAPSVTVEAPVKPVVAAEEIITPATATASLPRPAGALAGDKSMATLTATPGVLSAPAIMQQAQRITISFVNTPLREVLAQFAIYSGRSIVPGGNIGNAVVTAEIIDMPWDVAMYTILQAHGLAAINDPPGSTMLRIDSYANIQARAASEPLVTRNLALNYAKANEIAPTVALLLACDSGAGAVQLIGAPAAAGADTGSGDAGGAAAGAQPPAGGVSQVAGPGGCKPRGRVVPEVSTNQLIITEMASKIDTLLAYVASFDVRTPQVNISTKIVSIDRTATNDLGLSYDLGSATAFFNTLAPRTLNGTPQTSEFTVGLGGDAFAGVANAGRRFAGNSSLNLIYNTTIGGFSLTAFLDALTQENLTNIEVQPSVNTLDKKPAQIFVGDKVAYLITPPTAPGAIQNAAPQIQSTEIGSRLKVTPSISANRTIRLEVEIENSALTSLTEAGPTSSQRTASTVVLVQDGETAVIGGLTTSTTTKLRRGIPFLMQLPLIGKLFTENEDIQRNSDLLVLITPKILDDPIPGRN